jgi:type I restriction enzyme M protein
MDTISALNDEFKAMFDLGIIEAIDEINRDIKFISDVLEKGENGLLLNDYEKEIVRLVEINNIINTLSNNELKFSIKKQQLNVDEMKTRGILINKVLFRTLLDNLLTNANKYGFLDKNKGNHVMIELIEIDDHLIVDIRNNGLPFPNNFNREKFITKYSTADTSNGSGLGGYDINRIATYFENENWDLILNNDPIYPVIFRFSFPIKLLK